MTTSRDDTAALRRRVSELGETVIALLCDLDTMRTAAESWRAKYETLLVESSRVR